MEKILTQQCRESKIKNLALELKAKIRTLKESYLMFRLAQICNLSMLQIEFFFNWQQIRIYSIENTRL